MAGSEAPALRKPPATATPIRLPPPRQSPTLPPSAIDPLWVMPHRVEESVNLYPPPRFKSLPRESKHNPCLLD